MAKKKNDYALNLEEKIEMVRMSVRAVTRGYKISRTIIGPPGIGKSHAVKKELELEALDNPDLKVVFFSGGIKDQVSFYTMLCDNNDKNTIVVLDDINVVITNKDCRELLRQATENILERPITYASNRIVRGKTFYKPKTVFHSKVIIITNISTKKIDRGILSRTSPIEIDTSPQETYAWVGKNLENAPPHKMPFKWKEEVYSFIGKEVGIENLKQFDFRVFEDAMLWYGSCVNTKGIDDRGDKKIVVNEKWKNYVYTMCI